MTKREQDAFNQGVGAARQMALVAAVTLEVREGESDVRHRAASAAPQSFAEGAKVLMIPPTPSAVPGDVGGMDAPA